MRSPAMEAVAMDTNWRCSSAGDIDSSSIEEDKRPTSKGKGRIRRHENKNIIMRAPSPPIRYEVRSNDQLKPNAKRRGRSRKPSSSGKNRSSGSPRSRSTYSTSVSTVSDNSIKRSSDDSSGDDMEMRRRREKRGSRNRHLDEDDSDDNMSLISMTEMIAGDVCQLQNLRFENIGPDISNVPPRRDPKQETSSTDVEIIDFSKQRSSNVASIPNKQGGNNSKGSGNRTNATPSRQASRARQRPNMEEVRVDNDSTISDDISEITPVGCSPRRVCSDRIESGETHPNTSLSYTEESFRNLMISMTNCLPSTSEFQDLQRSFSADFDGTKQNKETTPPRTGIVDCLDENLRQLGPTPSSLPKSSGSGYPGAPVFKNNTDRYNQLVVGILTEDEEASDENHRKFSRAWFKSKRDISKRRNNTQIQGNGESTTRNYFSCTQNTTEIERLTPHTSVEVVWKGSASVNGSRTLLGLSSRHSKIRMKQPASEPGGTNPQQSSSRLRRLLQRGRSKSRERNDSIQQVKPLTSSSRRFPLSPCANDTTVSTSDNVNGKLRPISLQKTQSAPMDRDFAHKTSTKQNPFTYCSRSKPKLQYDDGREELKVISIIGHHRSFNSITSTAEYNNDINIDNPQELPKTIHTDRTNEAEPALDSGGKVPNHPSEFKPEEKPVPTKLLQNVDRPDAVVPKPGVRPATKRPSQRRPRRRIVPHRMHDDEISSSSSSMSSSLSSTSGSSSTTSSEYNQEGNQERDRSPRDHPWKSVTQRSRSVPSRSAPTSVFENIGPDGFPLPVTPPKVHRSPNLEDKEAKDLDPPSDNLEDAFSTSPFFQWESMHEDDYDRNNHYPSSSDQKAFQCDGSNVFCHQGETPSTSPRTPRLRRMLV